MRNVLYALGAGLTIFALLYLPGLLRMGESAVPGVLTVFIAYFILAKATFKKVEAVLTEAASYLHQMPPKVELAISTMEKALVYAPHQYGVQSQVDNQIGTLYFVQKQFNKALPYLERSLNFGHWMGGSMLGVIYYKKKNHEKMKATFQTVLKRAKKQGLVWNLYAYLLCQIGDRDQAQAILIEALKKTKDDPKVKDALQALQNGKKIKMKVYKEQWYGFHLESPPKQHQQMQVGGKMSKAARRGRW